MSLDVYLTAVRPCTVFDANITHNLSRMAKEAGLYFHLWEPEKLGITKASELIEPLSRGLRLLQSEPDKFRAMNPENGWGDYDWLCRFVESYLVACRAEPDAEVSVSR